MDPGVIGVFIPIVAIVFGIGSGMLKMYLNHQERMIDKKLGVQGQITDDVRQEMAALRAEVLRLRDTTTQYDLSIDHTLRELEQRLGTLENRNGRYVAPAPDEPRVQTLGISSKPGANE